MSTMIEEKNEKRIYIKPALEEVKVDKEISLIMSTDSTTAPDPGVPPSGGGIWG